jgi:phosphoenolpyruvate carboxykinase (GTP)
MVTPLENWVEEVARLTRPDRIWWCDGSEEEAHRLMEVGMKEEKIEGKPIFYELNQSNWPGGYLHRSHTTDVARTEHLTYVSQPDKETAGPNNNWMEPREAKKLMTEISDGCMRGKTMYVLPYAMGNHLESPYTKLCVQLTDISYVAISMRLMTILGIRVLDKIGGSENFVKGIHSVGDFDPNKRYIMHFPQENLVWSVGSGYGGNALLGKKCLSLRMASWLGLNEGWLAEHMVIMGIEDPDGEITYILGAFPSYCGKTNLAMLEPTLPNYKIWTLGDDIAWINIGPDGRFYAINPEKGFFGVASGTSMKTNTNMLKTLKNNKFYPTLFTNTGLNIDTNEPWWEGLDGAVPENMLDWRGNSWDASSGAKVAHPNARFTTSIYNTPRLSPEFDNPKGVPISAIIIGGRRTRTIPLIVESFDWTHGVFMGARNGSETTAAAAQQVGVLRRDPMAMLPFCGYNMGDYLQHWIDMGKKAAQVPRIYSANWFRVDEDDNFIWPGFGENIRVLKWIIDRVKGRVSAKETPLGLIPNYDDFALEGLDFPQDKFEKLFDINKDEWTHETAEIEEFFNKFGSRMPLEIWDGYQALKRQLDNSA